MDVQALSRIDCTCSGYVPVTGKLTDAAFAQPDSGPIPRLRPPGQQAG